MPGSALRSGCTFLVLLSTLLTGCGSRPKPGPDPTSGDRFADLRSDAQKERHDFGSEEGTEGLSRPSIFDAPAPASGASTVTLEDRSSPASPTTHRAPRIEAPEAPESDGAVAYVEVDLPKRERFHVRATVPVPADAAWEMVELEDGRRASPYALELAGGATIACQVERVARRPDGRPEVLELIAPVRREGVPGGEKVTRARFAVLGADDGRSPFPFPEDAAFDDAALQLLTSPTFALRATSVDGVVYRAQLPRPSGGGVRAEGPYVRRLFVAGVLLPEADGALQAHLHGYHAHLTLFSGDPRVSLDLRIHNGVTSGAAPDTPEETPVGAVYFESLELELPTDWAAQPLFRDPFFGSTTRASDRTVTQLVKPLEGGHLHLLPPSFQMQRRLTLAPAEALGEAPGPDRSPAFEGLGFVVDRGSARAPTWSWSLPETARYFPQRSPLPTARGLVGTSSNAVATARRELARRRDALVDLLANGGADGGHVQIPAMGWFHPYFHPYQGVSGGDQIRFIEGHYAACLAERAEIERLLVVHRMSVARQSVALWRADGRPAGVSQWLNPNGRIPFDFRTNAGWQPPELRLPYAHRGQAPAASIRAAAEAERRPAYDRGDTWDAGGERVGQNDCIYGWSPHDGQHLVRYTKNAKALVWLANDGLARDDLELEAERHRLMTHGHVPSRELGVTLTHLESSIEGRPGQGVHINRDHAWGVDAIVAAYAIADDEFRASFLPWLQRFTDLVLHAQMPNGLCMRERYIKLLGGRYDAAHAFQVEFLLLMRRSLVAGVFEGVDEERARGLRESFRKGLEYLFWGAPFHTSSNGRSGPAGQFAVAFPLAEKPDLPVFSDAEHWGPDYLPDDGKTGNVEAAYGWDLLAFAEEWTRGTEFGAGLENRYLARAAILWDGYRSLSAAVAAHRADERRRFNGPSGVRAAFLARVEQLTGRRR